LRVNRSDSPVSLLCERVPKTDGLCTSESRRHDQHHTGKDARGRQPVHRPSASPTRISAYRPIVTSCALRGSADLHRRRGPIPCRRGRRRPLLEGVRGYRPALDTFSSRATWLHGHASNDHACLPGAPHRRCCRTPDVAAPRWICLSPVAFVANSSAVLSRLVSADCDQSGAHRVAFN
jgi:hypothetical protein